MAKLKLVELGVNTEIIIEARLRRDSVQFDSKINYIKKGGLIITPIRHDGRIVNLHSSNLNVCVIYHDGKGAPIVWENCKIQQIIYRNKLQQFITCPSDSEIMNRRGSERVRVGASGRVTGKSGNVFAANVHDISETGFSIVAQHEITHFNNYPLSVKFEDADLNAKFNLKGKIVRREQLDDNLFLYGCKLPVKVTSLSRYVLQKKRMGKIYAISANKKQ